MAADQLKDLTLPQQLLHWACERPDAVALRQKEFGIWQPLAWSAYAQRAGHFALALLQLGLRRCRVAIASGATTPQPGDDSPVGTVGVPYPRVELALAEDGEILTRGDVIEATYA